MPVHEIRYRTWQGAAAGSLGRFLAVPRFTVLSVWHKWLLVSLLSFGLLPLLAWTGYIIFVSNAAVRELFNLTAVNVPELPVWDVFRRFFLTQGHLATLLVLVVAPKMISPEIQHRALPLVYSRPLNRASYIGGKFVACFAFVSLVTWVPALLLWIMMLANYPNAHTFYMNFWTSSVPLLFKAVFAGLLMAATASMVGLACSAATKSFRFAALLYFIIVTAASLFTEFAQNVGSAGFPNLGLPQLFYTTGLLLFDPFPGDDFSLIGQLFGMLVWAALAVGFMLWRLKPADVYSE